MNFSDEEIQRYSRQIILPEIGGKGQKKIRNARLFLIGAGGLGSPAALYLVAGGLGKLGLIDSDTVDLSNLQRQVLHTTKSVNQPKVESAKARLSAINPDCTIETYQKKLDASNIMDLISDYDIVLDGSDNFPTRFLVNDACFFLKKPLISASIFRFEGQITTIKGYLGDNPCYRCLFPEPPPADLVTSCQEAGVLGALAGTMGVLQATEAFKEILGVGSSLTNRLILYDALEMKFREFKTHKDPNCPLCGPHPKVTTLMEYETSCRLTRPPADSGMLSIPKEFYDAMIGQAQAEHPNECCGLLAGKDGRVTQIYPIKNIVASDGLESADFDDAKLSHLKNLSAEDRAEIAFVMDASEMSSAIKDMRLNNIKLQAVYHSHPNGPNRPSVTDIRNALGFASVREKLNLPEPLHIIISLQKKDQPDVKVYRIVEDQTTLEEFKIAG